MTTLVSSLKEMIDLEERRVKLAAELDKISSHLTSLKDRLLIPESESASSTAPTARRKPGRPKKAASVSTPAAAKPTKIRGGRAGRGALKARIVNELRQASAAGVSVKELSAKLGVKNTNIHSWFQSTGKSIPGIKKVGPARYALSGAAATDAPASAAPAKTAKKSRKTAKKGASKAASGKRGGARRGQLMESIVRELKAAGKKGLTIKDLSGKIGVPYKNIYIWFVTTGKKNPKIKRIAPATYKLS